jgi:hypothetical protein
VAVVAGRQEPNQPQFWLAQLVVLAVAVRLIQ